MSRKSIKSDERAAAPVAVPAADFPVSELKSRPRMGRDVTPAEFWRVTKEYPKNPTTEFQLYRRYPVIDRRLSGEAKKNIASCTELDEAWVLQNFGTGDYRVIFQDHMLRYPAVANTILRFPIDWERPPVLNQVELVEGLPDNKGYLEQLKIRGLWKRETEKNEMAETGAATAAVEKMGQLAADALKESRKPQAVEEALAKSIDIMASGYKAAAATIAEARGPQQSSGADVVLQVMMKRMDQQHEILMELVKERQHPAPAASIDSQLGVVSRVLEFAGRVNQSPAASWIDRLPDLFIQALPFLARFGAAPAAVAPGPVAVPAIAPAEAVNPEIEGAVIEAMAQSTGLDVQTLRAFMRVGGRAIRAYQDGYSGQAFAELVARTEGEELYGALFAVGKDTIIGTLRKLPALMVGPAAAVVHSPEFETWIDGFMAYGQDPPAEGKPAA